MTEVQKDMVECLDSALAKAVRFPGRLYRRIRFQTAAEIRYFIATHSQGAPVVYPHYFSVCKTAIGYDYSPKTVDMTIIGITAVDITWLSLNPMQLEMVFDRDTPFLVTETGYGAKGEYKATLEEQPRG